MIIGQHSLHWVCPRNSRWPQTWSFKWTVHFLLCNKLSPIAWKISGHLIWPIFILPCVGSIRQTGKYSWSPKSSWWFTVTTGRTSETRYPGDCTVAGPIASSRAQPGTGLKVKCSLAPIPWHIQGLLPSLLARCRQQALSPDYEKPKASPSAMW